MMLTDQMTGYLAYMSCNMANDPFSHFSDPTSPMTYKLVQGFER